MLNHKLNTFQKIWNRGVDVVFDNMNVILGIILAILMFGFIAYKALDPYVWYAGEHDSHCEMMLHGADDCHCCERLVEAEKKGANK